MNPPSDNADQSGSGGGPNDTVSLLRLENVNRIYDDGAISALHDINLSIDTGEFAAIVGPSGSGKSTLIHIMGGFDTCSSGAVYWRGRAIKDRDDWTKLRRDQIGFIFQEFHLLPTLTAVENVETALSGRGMPSGLQRKRAMELLDGMGLGARAKHLPYALSGGERQRVAIARSIANRPALLLADEPTGSLDSSNATAVIDLLLDLHRNGMTLVMVTHDLAIAARSPRQIHIKDGRVIGNEPTAGSRDAH